MQLGKLDGPQAKQALSCKTGNNRSQSNQWLTSERQNRRSLDLIVQRDDGRYQLGLADEGPGFETILFARDVWLRQMTRHDRRFIQ
jgi:hypothetical protein